MSDTSSGEGNDGPSGRGTHGGGGLIVSPPPPSPPPIVTNQQLLVLDRHVLTDLDDETRQAVKIVELEFARDVSALAVAAYDRIIQQLRPCESVDER